MSTDSSNSAAGREWDPDAAIEAVKAETQVHDEPFEKLTERLFRENTPVAAMAIIHLAQHADNDKIRLEAARTILDRTLGRVGDAKPQGLDDPFDKIAQVLAS